ncbi:MAG: MBL fold metallo-hydrolase [Vicinamibacterales bacterium]|nr:MBL fold metallo-hydrolase [Vicinamibacterales bacterium]
MTRKVLGLLFVLLACSAILAQQLPTGYVDPAPLLAAAAREIGEANLKCITFSGTGYSGAVGQAFESGVNIDWPRIDSMANYTRTINFETRTIKEEFDRKPGLNPASWKYGLGWQDGTPVQKNLHQTFVVNGNYGWHMDGAGAAPVPMSPEDVERSQLEIWMNPHGFIKAARLPGANPKAIWRWELGEMGRDGPTTIPERMHVVSITMGKHRIDATINKQNQIQRIHTMVAEPALGDFNYEHESTNQQTFGDVKWPTAWHSHQGWDDNFGFDNVSAGHNAFGGTFEKVQPNVCNDPVPVPESVRQAQAGAPQVTVDKMADGVYLLGGGPANSIAVEFRNFVTVFEAPTNEARSLAVIEQITKLAPGKPIRYLVSSHQHFDHIGGIRTYLHIGATIVTQRRNINFLNHDVLNYRARTVDPDMVTLWPPTEVAEGYNYESFNENYVITDGSRIMNVFYVQPLRHAEGMAMAYLPAEKILMQANLFDTHEPPPAAPTPSMTALYHEMRMLNLDVATIAPVHGKSVPMAAFIKAMGSAAKDCPMAGTGGSVVWAPCR